MIDELGNTRRVFDGENFTFGPSFPARRRWDITLKS